MDSLSSSPDQNNNGNENEGLSTSVDLLHPGAQQGNDQSGRAPQAPQTGSNETPPYTSPASNKPSYTSPASNTPQHPQASSYIPTSTVGSVPHPTRSQHTPFILAGIVLLVLSLAGGGYYYFVSRDAAQDPGVQQPSVITVSTTEPQFLVQLDSSGIDNLAPETAINESSLVFSFKLPGITGEQPVTPEIEIVPTGTEFTNEPTAKGEPFTGDTAAVAVADLADGSYRWQARISRDSEIGVWAPYGTDPESADFIIDTKAPEAPVVTAVDGQAVGSGKVSTTTNRPKIEGTAEADSNISLQAGTISFNARADEQGKWVVEPTTNIATGDITLTMTTTDMAGNSSQATSLALAVANASTGDQTAGTDTNTGTTTTTPDTDETASTDDTLAATGDNTALLNLFALVMILFAASGLIVAKRDANS